MVSRAGSNEKQSDEAVPPRVGPEIQRLRTERKLTLEDLSRMAGVSKSMLSEIERNRANPTIAVVWRLTNALGVSFDSLFATQAQQAPVKILNAQDSPVLSSQSSGYKLRVWGPVDLAGSFEWYELTLQPGGELVSSPHEPGTHEHLTVFQGSINIEVANVSETVLANQTARYPADVAHALRNTSNKPAVALLVVVHT